MNRLLSNRGFLTLFAFGIGAALAIANLPLVDDCAKLVTETFMRLLRLVSVPIIFLSLVVTISSIDKKGQAKQLLSRLVRYTLLTTVIAALVALLVYNVIRPAGIPAELTTQPPHSIDTNYVQHLLSLIPTNWVQPFVDGNVMAVLLLALGLSFAMTSLDEDRRRLLHSVFDACFRTVMVVTGWIVRLLPIAVFGFAYVFVKDLQAGLEVKTLGYYLAAILLANLIQAVVALPLLLKWHGISPLKTASGMWPALSLAFFSKSSASTIPLAIKCAEENLHVSHSVTRFSFPLCTTINMNACAGFILITVLFVSQSNGVVFTPFDMLLWVGVATIAAVGNAGVPMGCYFLTSALLTTMNVPITLLGFIAPFYAILDMFETAINVWSDSCVTVIAAQEQRSAVIEVEQVA